MSYIAPFWDFLLEINEWALLRLMAVPQFLRDAPAKVVRDDLFAAFVLLSVLMVRFSAGYFSLQPVRTAYRRPYLCRSSALKLRARRTLRRELLRALRHSEKSIRTPEVAQTCSSIRIAVWTRFENSTPGSVYVSPRSCDIVSELHLLVAKSLEPRNQNIITRFIVSARWEGHVEHLKMIDAYLMQFSALSPTLVSNIESSAGEKAPTFAETISCATGAVILADLTTDTTALSTTSTAVWHERIWFGDRHPSSGTGRGKGGEDEKKAPSAPKPRLTNGKANDRGRNTYSNRRNGVQQLPPSLTSPYELAARKKANQTAALTKRLGSFNGRIPILLQAEVTRSLGLEEPILLLITGETDYDATEERAQTMGTKTPNSANATPTLPPMEYGNRACKKLPYLPAGTNLSLYRPIRSGQDYYSGSTCELYDPSKLDLPEVPWRPSSLERVILPNEPARAYQLNGKATFICRTAKEGGGFHAFAVLMNRSMANENGFGVAATTAGGVLSLPVPKGFCDGNEFGALDPVHGVQREISEELGLEPSEYSLSFHAVVQHNSRPLPRQKDDKLAVNNGELTSTCLAIAHTNLSYEELSSRRFTGSAAAGLAEADGLIAVPLGKSAEEFYQAITTGKYCQGCSEFFDDPKSAPLEHCERTLTRLVDNIEQMALVSLAYCSAVIHDVKSTKSIWRTSTLWTDPHPGSSSADLRDANYARVCADPKRLYDCEDFNKVLKSIGGSSYERFETLADSNHWS